MRAIGVLGLVPCASVIDRDPGRGAKTCAQHFASFFEEGVLTFVEQPHDLPLGDADAQIPQQHEQTRDGDLPLVVLAEDEALSSGPKWLAAPAGNAATTVSPEGISQRSRRKRTVHGFTTRSWTTNSS